jgi:hypothetical protein
MAWPESLAESLPEPRDDEPASLRQDIADELADHLQSSLSRQLVTTADADTAQAQVVDRFGNPRRLARQLWYEAMQEKIMRQRVLLAITALLATVCLVAVAMLWRVVERGHAVTQELLAENREANRALLDQLAALSRSPAENSAPGNPAQSLDWNPVRAHLVVGEKNGPPAEGFTVRLSKQKPGESAGLLGFATVAEERTGPDGIADLGLAGPGKYELTAMMRDAGAFENFSMPITVLPGSVNTLEVVCPLAKMEKVDVVIRAKMPEDLSSKNLYLTVELVLGPRTFSGSEWRSGFNGVQAQNGEVVIVIAPDGRIGMTPQGIMSQGGEKLQLLTSSEEGEFFKSPDEHQLSLFLTSHYLKTLRICAPPSPIKRTTRSGWLAVKSEWHFVPENRRLYPGPFDYSIAGRDLVTLPKFTAEPGKINEWQIAVPPEFWEQVRADLERSARKTEAEEDEREDVSAY